MQEITCSTCGRPVQGDECPYCRAATAIATPEHAAQAKVTPPASSDSAFSEGPPPVHAAPDRTPLAPPEDDPKSKATAAGCCLTLLSVAVIFGSAVPIVTWRDPDSGLPMPRMLAIAAPLLAGALCYAVGVGILKVLGVRIVQKRTERTDADPE